MFFSKNDRREVKHTDTYEKIAALCAERGIRLSALARGTGVRSSVFTELKMGRTRQLSVQTLRKIAEYFGVPESYFLEEDAADALQEELFRKRKLLFDKTKNASSEELETILRIVNAMVGDE